MTIKQARARFKQVFKSDAPEELSIEDIQAKLDAHKAMKAVESMAKNSANPDKEPKAKKATKVGGAQEYKVRFGVIIPGMGKYSKSEIEANEDVMEYLIDIGSPAVVKL